jgi:hypothetical protein
VVTPPGVARAQGWETVIEPAANSCALARVADAAAVSTSSAAISGLVRVVMVGVAFAKASSIVR